ncbi:MFS transporter [Sphingomonas sp. CGMCC 1.13654]|uniref:MFS transporter n=1 Tax=Sphingomonas chungangi TaxID=2683589 RepID=A0A838L8Q2_9SPHN|nr:MFS transporter [Sphingomonas chungangi]MVW56797.1 MFS transporter [Sphingomonas chungangi]
MTAAVLREASAGSQTGRLGILVPVSVFVAMLEGFDIQALSIAAPVIAHQFGLGERAIGTLFAVGQGGLVLGAVLGGGAGDRYGRRRMMVLGIFCFGVFSLITGLVAGSAMLALLRGMTGIGLGLVMPNLIGMAAEYAPERHRGKIISAILGGIPAGGMIVALAGAGFMEAWGWRSLFIAGGLLPILVMPLMVFLPGRSVVPVDVDHIPAMLVSALFGEDRGPTTLLLWVALLLTAGLLYMTVSWLPSLIRARGYSLPVAHLASAMFSGGGCLGSFATGFVVDRIGYRRILPALYVGVLIGICGVLFGVDQAVMLGGAFVLGVFVVGCFYSLNGLSPLFYPEAVRGLGTGCAVGLGRIGSILGPLGAGWALQAGIGPYGPGPAAIPPVAIPLCALAFIAVCLLTRRDRKAIRRGAA